MRPSMLFLGVVSVVEAQHDRMAQRSAELFKSACKSKSILGRTTTLPSLLSATAMHTTTQLNVMIYTRTAF
jgi:hypothetical protein